MRGKSGLTHRLAHQPRRAAANKENPARLDYIAERDSMWVGLFSSHANELRKVHRHLRRGSRLERSELTSRSARKAQPRISNEGADRIVEGYAAGKTVYELANDFGCHRVTVSALLKRRGISLRRTSPTEEQAIEMMRLYQSGLSLAKVGEHFDVHASTVLAQLRKRGVPTRTL